MDAVARSEWEAVAAGGTSAFFLALLVWMLGVFVLARADVYQTFTTIDNPPLRVRFNWRNVSALVFIFLEFAQLTSLSLIPAFQVYPESTVDSAFAPMLFDFGEEQYLLAYWLAVTVALLWWLLASYLAVNAFSSNLAGALTSIFWVEDVAKFLSHTL